jgi:hypothetical protein
MLVAVFAALCTGLFAGAALYINIAEHRHDCRAVPSSPYESFARAIVEPR